MTSFFYSLNTSGLLAGDATSVTSNFFVIFWSMCANNYSVWVAHSWFECLIPIR